MPVYVVDDDPVGRFVEVGSMSFHTAASGQDARLYAEHLTRLRLHQPVFHARVLAAYERRCAICRLRHVDLLDDAHIVGDAESGQPVVPDGLALCKIHHAAHDRQITNVRPDDLVRVRADVLEEVDGPMLRRGLQDVHDVRQELPTRREDRPDRELLGQRWATFSSTT